MARVRPVIAAFNRGLISRLGLARVDLDRTRLSAETQTNLVPRVLGSGMFRPGFEWLGYVRADAKAVMLPFVFEVDDKALLEFTEDHMRVWIDDAVVSRPSVSARLLNGTFPTSIANWTDDDEAGATSSWDGGNMALLGNGGAAAQRWQQVTTGSGQSSTEHAIRVVVRRGPVTVMIGSTNGSDDMLGETALGTGTHSIAFTPNASSFFVTVSHRGSFTALLDAIQIDASGPLELPTPYQEADVSKIRWTQSRDVVFLACEGFRQRRIERRAARSWSITEYLPENGPFRLDNGSNLTITPSDLSGDVTLAASSGLFRSGHVGALFRLSSSGQKVSATIAAQNTFTAPGIRVTGVGDDRKFTASVATGTTSTVTLQRAVGQDLSALYEDVQAVAAGATVTIDDDLDNQIIFYRIGIKSGDYTDNADVTLTFARGAIDGYCRVTAVASPTSASATVLSAFGGTDPTSVWAEGEWSDFRGYPSATTLFQGRLWWGGRGKLWASESDAFDSFDENTEGDSGPISKFITDGPSDIVAWMHGTTRLIVGTVGGCFAMLSSSLDEPLTPTASQMRRFSTSGVANVPAVVVDDRVQFVQRSNLEVLEVSGDPNGISQQTVRMTAIVPEVGEPGFIKAAVQHQPDTRVHYIRSDGTSAILLTDPLEDVRCWVDIETDGVIEDVVTLPSDDEDATYYVVRRTINGIERRSLERWAKESECRGGAINKIADSHYTYSGAATNTITGLDHLEGESAVIWADGKARDNATVTGGSVTVSGDACASATVGLGYRGRYKSTKLAYGAQMGTALTQPKRIQRIGLVLADTHRLGVKYGQGFDNMDFLPTTEGFAAVDDDAVHAEYSEDMFTLDGQWDTDSRLCMEMNAPYPATLLAAVIDIETTER